MTRRALCRATLLVAATRVVRSSSQVSSPPAGFVRYDNQPAIQTVLGVPGSFVFGEPLRFGKPGMPCAALAASFSDEIALIADGTGIQLLRTRDGSLLATQPYSGLTTPLVSLTDQPQSALVWLPDAHTLLRFDGGVFVQTSVRGLDAAASVTSISLLPAQRASLLLAGADGTVSEALVDLPGGEVRSLTTLPGVQAPAYRFGKHLLWRNGNELEIENASGTVKHLSPAIPAGSSFTVERMSEHWLHLYFAGNKTHWALDVSRAEPVLARLPAPTSASGARR